MKNLFGKKYKWLVTVVIVIVICTACGKEIDGQKMMVSALGVKYINDYRNRGIQFLNSQIFGIWTVTKEPSDNLTENNIEAVKEDEESANDNTVTSQVDRKITEDNMVASQTSEVNKEDKWDVDFEVKRDGYIYYEQRNEIDIYYPQLIGFNDSAKEERINALIEEDVKKIIGNKNKEGDNTLYCISLDYEIKFLNERIISILYKGMYGYIMPGHGLNAKAITTTIDIEEEKVIALKDVVTDFAELSDMLMADEFEHVTKWGGSAGGYKVSWEFNSREELEENLGEIYQQWYTDGNNFVVIIENMMADYNEYSISNESVNHILDTEFLKKLK